MRHVSNWADSQLRSLRTGGWLPFLGVGALALVIIAGCGPQQAPVPTAPGGAAQETPRQGGVLEVAFAIAEPAHIDPLRSTLAQMNLNGRVYNGLLQYDPLENTKIIGELAERWEASPDGKTYTFYLHKGVKWHDGTPFTAADVKYTFDRFRDPNDPLAADLSSIRETLNPLERVEVADGTTVRMLLSRNSSSFLGAIALGTTLISPKHANEQGMDLSKTALGTGPFKLAEYQRGAVFRVVRNPDYFVKDRPYLDSINVYLLKDNATRVAAFTTGQIKLLSYIYKPEVEQIKKDVPQVVVSTKAGLRNGFVQVHNEKPPFNDARVRRAIHLAMDRQAALNVLVPGEGKVGTLIDPELSAFSQEELLKLPGYRADKTQDLAEAKKLMAEAGYPNGFKTTMSALANSQDYGDLAVYAKDQLAKLGIDTTINLVTSTQNSSNLTLGNYDMAAVVGVLRYADPSSGGYKYGKGNDVRFKDAQFQELLERQDSARTPEERKKLVRQMEERWLEVSPYVVLYWKDHSAAMYPEVRGYQIGVGIYNTHRFQDVWLAK